MNDKIDKESFNEFRNFLYKMKNDEYYDESTTEEIRNNTVFNKFINIITQIISGEDNEITEEDAFNLIINEYYKLLSLFGTKEIQTFNFKTYNNSHFTQVNNVDYNFDECINDENVSESLTFIDSVIEALNFDNSKTTFELILKRIEKLIKSDFC